MWLIHPGGNGTLDLWHLSDTYSYFLGPPATFALGPGENLFTAISYSYGGVCYIVEEPLYGAEGSSPNFSRVAGASNCGFSSDGGHDNTVTNTNTVQLSGTGAASAPSFSPPSLSFPSTAVNQSSSSTVAVTNNGNAKLTVSGITLGGTKPKMFTYTSNCTGQIAPKATCNLQVTFKPTTAGTHSAVLNIADNSPASPHAVSIAGTGLTAASSKMTVVSSANPATGCAPVLFSVAVSGTAGKTPTGSVELKRGTTVLVSAPLTNGRALLSTPALAPGSNLLSAGYRGDETYSPSASPTFTQMVASAGSCRGVEPLKLPETAER